MTRLAQGAAEAPAPPYTTFRCIDSRAVAWPNGAGTTRELTMGHWPTSRPPFDWRLSIADLASAPFSDMPGLDRVITVIDGPAITLTVEGRQHEVSARRPFTFRGDHPVKCSITQPVKALNVMVRRATTAASVSVRLGSGQVSTPMSALTHIVGLHGAVSVRDARGQTVNLQPCDVAVLAAPVTIGASPGSRFAIVRIYPKQ